MRYLLFSILFVLTQCSATDSPPAGTRPNIPAPDFTLTSLDGEQITLSELRGNVVYLFFYGAGCPHCRTNGPVTETQIYQAFKNQTDFVALGLDTWNQSIGANQSFRSVTGISYPLLLNARTTLINFYGNSSDYDRSVVINRSGNIIYQGNAFVDTDFETLIDIITQELQQTN